MDADLLLQKHEEDFLSSISKLHKSGGDESRLQPIRASVLRRLILGLPLKKWSQPFAAAQIFSLPEEGLRLHHLEVTADVEDAAQTRDGKPILDLEDACAPGGIPLPPLELEDCLFQLPIYMSLAKLRALSLKGSYMTQLNAEGLRVEGTLNISDIASAQDHRLYRFAPGEKKTGATHHPPTEKELVPLPRVRPNESVPLESEWEKQLAEARFASKAAAEGLCWIQLSSSHIGIDLIASNSRFVAPIERKSFFNSPHSRHALDLRGSHIRGRLTFSPAVDDRDKPRFTAIGGVSLVRCVIDGSVYASGSHLVAIEGNALSAQRADVKGHVFLDYSWENQKKWVQFCAEGFIDLTNARMGASLHMHGALLLRDANTRAGLEATGIHIAGSCHLRGIMSKDESNSENKDGNKYESFCSHGGVNLSGATIYNELRMGGAKIEPSSFGNSLYAPGITVYGDAKLTASKLHINHEHPVGFEAEGAIIFISANFKKNLDMNGAKLTQKEDKRQKPSIDASQITVQGSFLFGPAQRSRVDDEGHSVERTLFAEAAGSILLRNARIGMNLEMTGATIKALNDDDVALDLTCAEIQSDLHLNAFIPKDGSSKIQAFSTTGSVVLQGAKVENRLSLIGASLKCSKPGEVLIASNLHVSSRVDLGTDEMFERGVHFEARGGINFRRATMPTGLWMVGSIVTSEPEKPSHAAEEGSKKQHKILPALSAETATILYLNLDQCEFTGSLNFSDMTATNGFNGIHLNVKNGVVRFWESSLGFLMLKDFAITGTPPLDKKREEKIADLKKTEESFSHNKKARRKIEALKSESENVTALVLTRAKISGKLTIDIKPGAVNLVSETNESLVAYADLRELELGSLDDKSNEGWDTLRLKLEGFTCRRAPRREPATWQQDRSKIPWYYIFPVSRRYRQLHGNKNLHIEWLNRQYKDPTHPQGDEFTSSAYDRLSELLRDDGYDSEAKRVLSAKFTIKREVDVPVFVLRRLWGAYHFLFDYGLSPTRALGTFTLCIVFGSLFFWYGKILSPPRANEPVLVATPGPLSTMGISEGKDDHRVGVITAPIAGFREEIPCGNRIDPILYAFETFVPALEFTETRVCEVSTAPYAQPWRWIRALYVLLGWIVTSITLLTIPGILRNRAEG